MGPASGALRASQGGGDKPHVVTMAHGQGGAEIGFDHGPTLTCNHKAPIVAHTLKGEGFDASEDGTGRGIPLVPVAFDCKGSEAASNIIGATPTLRAMGHSGSHANVGGQLAVAWAVGSHAGAADGNQTNCSHAAGGPVGLGIQQDVAYLLRAGREQGVATRWSVRRLTPMECERLQGFPDRYTQVPYRGKPAFDGPRYKALGNSMAVNCMEYIGRRVTLVESVMAEMKGAA